jgi:hypothetical protein
VDRLGIHFDQICFCVLCVCVYQIGKPHRLFVGMRCREHCLHECAKEKRDIVKVVK